MKPKAEDQYTDDEAQRRARETIRHSFALPYKPHKALVGKTPRAKARKRKGAKGFPKSP